MRIWKYFYCICAIQVRYLFINLFIIIITIIIIINTRSSQSIEIGKSDLIDIDCIDQSVEIDDTLVSFIDLSWFLPILSICIGRYICSSKNETNFMTTVLICWQLSCNWESKDQTIITFLKIIFKKY